MKNSILVFLILPFTILSCSENNDIDTSQTNITFNFGHVWDETQVTSADFNNIKFTNAKGNQLSIEKLRYLISKITFTTSNNEILVLKGYNLVDLTQAQSLSFSPIGTIPVGNYSNVSFTFGFDNDDNYVKNGYADLNVALFNVPAMLGGGYHYMQFDGKFLNATNQEQGFNYHVIHAVDNPGANPIFRKDTFFSVNLGAVNISKNTTFNIEMNIAEWFKTPNPWDLNILNQELMSNSDAQIKMFENGQNVFSLKSIDQ
jgi:hypothetical protein